MKFYRLGNFTTEDGNSSPRFGDFGDVANRVEMRRQMSCKSFQWYLDTVATRVPRPSLIGAGEIRHGSVCLEINDRVDFIGQQIEARECGNSTGNSGPLPDIYVQGDCPAALLDNTTGIRNANKMYVYKVLSHHVA